jgi:hypothetical protein
MVLVKDTALDPSIRTWYTMRGRFLCNLNLTRLVCHIVVVVNQPDAWYRRWPTSNRTGYGDSLHDTVFNKLAETTLKKAAIGFGRVQEALKAGDLNEDKSSPKGDCSLLSQVDFEKGGYETPSASGA